MEKSNVKPDISLVQMISNNDNNPQFEVEIGESKVLLGPFKKNLSSEVGVPYRVMPGDYSKAEIELLKNCFAFYRSGEENNGSELEIHLLVRTGDEEEYQKRTFTNLDQYMEW